MGLTSELCTSQVPLCTQLFLPPSRSYTYFSSPLPDGFTMAWSYDHVPILPRHRDPTPTPTCLTQDLSILSSQDSQSPAPVTYTASLAHWASWWPKTLALTAPATRPLPQLTLPTSLLWSHPLDPQKRLADLLHTSVFPLSCPSCAAGQT